MADGVATPDASSLDDWGGYDRPLPSDHIQSMLELKMVINGGE